MALRLIIFDLDGTLADTQDDLAASVNATRGFRGLPPLGLPEIRSAIGDGARSLVERTVGTRDVEASLAHFIQHYRDHSVVKTRLYPGVREVLEATRDRLRAVVTNKPERISRRILKALEVDGHFVEIIGGDTLPVKKPDPAAVLGLLGRHAVKSSEALLVGDSPVDVATAKAAGISSAALRGGYADPAALEASRPDLLLSSLGELLRHLG